MNHHGNHCQDEDGLVTCGWPELHSAIVTPSHPITVTARSYSEEATEWDDTRSTDWAGAQWAS